MGIIKNEMNMYTSCMYTSCMLCPKNCRVNRNAGETGFCGETSDLRIGAAVIHKGEEPPLVGVGGSGTIFISGCNLGCNFCQNHQVSQKQVSEKQVSHGSASFGRIVTAGEFSKICAALRDNGAENINIVTGSHAIPGIIEGLNAARKIGVNLPVLWNSSAYETTCALELLSDYVEIFLPDLKTLDSGISAEFFNAPDYPKIAEAAILKMLEIAKGRVIIRHLILPGFLESTRQVLRWFADNAAHSGMLSLMTQYTPIEGRNKPMPQRFLSESEYDTVMQWLIEFDIEDGFCQELITGSDWLPDFKLPNPFPSELSVPVWNPFSES